MRRFRAITAVAAALVLAAGLVAPSAADEPAPPFPYAELAALAGLVAPVEAAALEGAVVRLRPALDWPVVATLDAGTVISATAITPGVDPWLRVMLADGSTGWVRAVDVDARGAAFARLPVRTAAPVRVRARAASGWAFVRPGGGPRVFTIGSQDETYAVFGRSIDGAWLAVAPGVEWPPYVERASEFAWVWADLLYSGGSGELLEQLPVFVGGGTFVVSAEGEGDPVLLSGPPASVWQWTADGLLAGVEGEQIWLLDPERETVTRDAPPTGGRSFSPDGRYAVVMVPGYSSGSLSQSEYMGSLLYLIAVDGSRVVAFSDAFRYPQSGGGVYRYGPWSPDSRWLIVAGTRVLDGVPTGPTAVSVDGEIHALRGLGSGPPVWLNAETLASHSRGALQIGTPQGEITRTIAPPSGGPRGWSWDIVPQPGRPIVWLSTQESGWYAANYATGGVSKIDAMADRGLYAQVVWSPNGAYALVLQTDELPALYDDRFGTLRPLAAASELQSDAGAPFRNRHAAWSPNSSEFILQTSRESIDLFRLTPPDGGEQDVKLVRKITAEGYFALWCEGHDQWSPSGDHFVVHQHEAGDVGPHGRDGLAVLSSPLSGFHLSRLLIFNREGQLERSYRSNTPHHWAGSLLQWSPDGRWLAFGSHFGRGCPLRAP